MSLSSSLSCNDEPKIILYVSGEGYEEGEGIPSNEKGFRHALSIPEKDIILNCKTKRGQPCTIMTLGWKQLSEVFNMTVISRDPACAVIALAESESNKYPYLYKVTKAIYDSDPSFKIFTKYWSSKFDDCLTKRQEKEGVFVWNMVEPRVKGETRSVKLITAFAPRPINPSSSEDQMVKAYSSAITKAMDDKDVKILILLPPGNDFVFKIACYDAGIIAGKSVRNNIVK